ncbi:MAG: PP2C family protein-serine/threonine phosphatase [Planctomycetaceae bacterium]
MKVLVAWNVPDEADLLQLYLGVDENEVVVCLTAEAFVQEIRHGGWDAVLMSLSFPENVDQCFPLFQVVREELPAAPAVVVCRPDEMVKLARFMTSGLRYHVVRDPDGDFVFLLLSLLDSAIDTMRAEESRKLADRLREEMEGVRRLQESIIPQGIVAPAGYDVVARYMPAEVTVLGGRPVAMAGGDYYNIFSPDPHTLVLLIGDASGHGLKACMSIMAMHTLVRMIPGEQYRDTARFVAEINRRLCENSIVQSEGGFITLLFATIDTERHTMTWTSAGHPVPQVQRLASGDVRPIGSDDDTGLPLAILADAEYTAQECPVPAGSRILMFSDGLTDALSRNSATDSFGLAGIVDTLRASCREPLESALDRLFHDSSEFTGGAGRHDDTSAVLFQRGTIGQG